ncbi:C4-dicarboxylate ABC transporter permease [Pokkaliibacter plantistimulans]|uniref:TRAP transporter large permease protein n=2 Tax=Pseudomonadota TaxID=1224 RepID=A0ABX5LVI8_9GAMM|nr:TRAP transporter large permease [Pokkaliibacter plantistimulans]PPC76893.1 C4-dicarboxylate ABC transporter permease [Pokkaliibacter plantistimulans]PXF29188.1 C4-dicarboxylate ABC transporter permease [Pokkaliibacter plantistimulans]
MSLAFFWVLLASMAIGLPVAFAMLLAPGISLVLEGKEAFFLMLTQRLYNGIDSFPLMAVPFFMLAGEIMNRSGITLGLVNFSQAFIGHLRGGLAQINILSSMLFAGLSGSAVADCSTLGKMLIPAMEQNGYSRKFAAAVTAASSIIGPIIPPSGIMILYAYVMNVSVGGLFAAGIVPGAMIGGGMMAMTWLLAKRRNYPVAAEKASWKQRGKATKEAFWPLMTPVILLGGILSGIFTPTEAAAVSAAYALVISLISREMTWKDLPGVLYDTAKSSAVILFLVGSAVAFSSVVSLSGTPQKIAHLVLEVTHNPLLLLLIINIVLLIVGMFLDAGPAILILGPILGPVLMQNGIDPLHFAIVMCVNLTIGLATPPMGLVLFVASSISNTRVETIAREMLPYLAVHIAVIALITYIPALTLTLPRLFGFAG